MPTFLKNEFHNFENWNSLSSLGVGLKSDSFSVYIFIVPAFSFSTTVQIVQSGLAAFTEFSHTDHRLVAPGQNPLEITEFCQIMFCTLKSECLYMGHMYLMCYSPWLFLLLCSALTTSLLSGPWRHVILELLGGCYRRLLPTSTFLAALRLPCPFTASHSLCNQQQEGKAYNPSNVRIKTLLNMIFMCHLLA